MKLSCLLTGDTFLFWESGICQAGYPTQPTASLEHVSSSCTARLSEELGLNTIFKGNMLHFNPPMITLLSAGSFLISAPIPFRAACVH